jgi:acetylornithine deacetylase/succinyl-diaminopimelate desuccinylase
MAGTIDAAEAAAGAVEPGDVLRFARALITVPSENPGGTEDGVATVAAEILAGLGAAPEIVRSDEQRPSVLATVGGPGTASLAWNGHLDVVPAGSLDTWSHPPFAGDVASGKLIGRGAADMKGPIAAAMAAFAGIRRAGIALGGSLTYHLAADEEFGGVHGTKVLWERGLLTQDAAVVGEPSELTLGLAERGGAMVVATAFGKAAHGSQPHRGVNAITSMARFLMRLEEVLPDVEHPLAGRPTVNAAMIEGGSAPNVVPDRCSVEIDRRLIPGETDQDAVLGSFRDLADSLHADREEIDLRFEIREWAEPAETDPGSEIARVARGVVEAETGRRAVDTGFTGITDARFYINGAHIPTVILGPGSLTVAHTADEWVDVGELVAGAPIYARLFVGFLGA